MAKTSEIAKSNQKRVRPSAGQRTAFFYPQAPFNLSAGLGLGLLRPQKVLSRTHENIRGDFLLASKIQYESWKLHTVILMKHHDEASPEGICSDGFLILPLMKKILKVLTWGFERLIERIKTLLRRLCYC